MDGVVTEDSDVFLFGAEHVYRNIFDQKKYVERCVAGSPVHWLCTVPIVCLHAVLWMESHRYCVSDITRDLGLSRLMLVHMAMLLGSDYTTGETAA